MLRDLPARERSFDQHWDVEIADARQLPDTGPTYSAVISSPSYPNRHDYTRVFGVELMFAFLDWSKTRKLRYQSIQSHPEARPQRPDASAFELPRGLARAIGKVKTLSNDPRIPRMLYGYFLDIYLCLLEIRRVCKSGARIAFILGNAQYCGVTIRVGEYTAQIGEQTGLLCENILVARYRGNSAQQMGRFGRTPSRESVIIFRRH